MHIFVPRYAVNAMFDFQIYDFFDQSSRCKLHTFSSPLRDCSHSRTRRQA